MRLMLWSTLCLLACGTVEDPNGRPAARQSSLTSDFGDAVVRSERTATGGRAVVWDTELRTELATFEWEKARGVFSVVKDGHSLPAEMIPDASLEAANDYTYGLWRAVPAYGLLKTRASGGAPAEVDYKRYDYYGPGGVWCGSCYDVVWGYGFCYWPCPAGCEMYDFGWAGC